MSDKSTTAEDQRPARPTGVTDEATSPPLLAVIDVGSAALRMAIGEAQPDGELRRLETLEAPVAIGLDTMSQGHIRAATTEAAIKTFGDFISLMRTYGIEPDSCRAVATTAVRGASNRDVFLDRVAQTCGLRIEVIEAIEELRLVYQHVRRALGQRFDSGTCLLLCLGAGGSQVVVQKGGTVVFEETLNFGLMRLDEMSGGAASPSPQAVRGFLGKVVRAIQRVLDLTQVSYLVVVSKDFHALLQGLGKVQRHEAGLDLDRKELARLQRQLERLNIDKLQHGAGLDFATASRARVALEMAKAFADAADVNEITVPGGSMLESLLLDALLAIQKRGGGDPMAPQIESAARALGRKYRYDPQHGENVRLLALQLFDDLREMTHLSDRSRLLLSVAAILHDIGYYVGPRDHELHTAYLISASEIMGLRRQEVERVSLVARCHRRPGAALAGQDLDQLPPKDRVEVLKLSSLLRLAEALDQDHLQRVERVSVQWSDERLHVLAATRSGSREEFASIAAAFKKKRDLFKEVFGVKPTLREVLPQ